MNKESIRSMLSLYRYLGRYKTIFIPSLIALFLTAALSLAFPYFLGELVGEPKDALTKGIDPGEVKSKIDSTIKILLVVLAVQALIAFFRVQGFIRSGESALNDIRRDVFSQLVHLPLSYHQKFRAGELSGRIAADLGILRDTLLTTIPQFARQSVILIGSIIFIFITSTKLSLIMLSVIPVVVLFVAIFGRKIRSFSKASQDALAESTVIIEESVQGVTELKSFTNEEFEKRRFRSSLDQFLEVTFKGAYARAAFISFIIFVMMGSIAVVVWFGAQMLNEGTISSIQFTRFVLFSIFVAASLGSLPEIISQFQKTAGATERIRELLGETVEDEGGECVELNGGVEFADVSFSYPSRPEANVLEGVNFSVNEGERVAFVGPSGGGKSTLFSLLLRLFKEDSGFVRFDGKPAGDLSLSCIRKSIAIVPQDVLLFGGSILENIAYGRPGASEEDIYEAARQANAYEFIEAFPEKFETLVGPRGVKLSGGQRQRIAIARAILANPKLLLLDEATSALDSENERLVQDALNRLMESRTSIIIAHRLSTVRDVDRLFVLSGGKIVESGTHDELMNKEGMYQVLAKTQLL